MAKKTSIMSQLKKLQKGWASSEPTRGGIGLPDGLYDVRIESASLNEAKESGRLQVVWELIVLNEEHENKKVLKFDGLTNEQSFGFLMGSLETLELEVPDEITDLGESLEAAAGVTCQVQVKSKDEFTNIYFNGLIDGEEAEEEAEEDAEEDKAEGELEVGGRVVYTDSDDDETYPGEITEIDGDDITIKCDDGDEVTCEAGDLELEEAEEAGEEDAIDADAINAMKIKELKSFVEEEEIRIKGASKMKAGPLRKAIIKKLDL